MKIKVTQEHIDYGGADAVSCPVALAVNDAYSCDVNDEFVSVSINRIIVYPHGVTTDLPDVTKEFIACYDLGRPVRPFDFELGVLR